MSMNLHLEASTMAKLKLPKGGKRQQILKEEFNLRQTPTSITYKCLAGNAYELYKEWVMSSSKPEKIYIYKDNDVYQEGEPVSFEMYDDAKEHLEELDFWLKCHKGWKIEWFAL